MNIRTFGILLVRMISLLCYILRFNEMSGISFYASFSKVCLPRNYQVSKEIGLKFAHDNCGRFRSTTHTI